jgi:opacity protein-like surface antigen
MRRILLAMAVAALMAVMVASSAAAAQPVGECPESYEPGLVTVKFVLKGANLDEPDPSMDPNGDGWTCLKLAAGDARGVPFHSPDAGTKPPAEGEGLRATWHDNNL